MTGSANTSEPSTQTKTGWSVASLASGPTMLHECMQAILHLGGTWPCDGMKITSGRSASPAIFTDKENSGFLAAILTASTKAELMKLCNERTRVESFRLGSYTHYRTTTKNSTCNWPGTKELPFDHQKMERIEQLRSERLEHFRWFAHATKRWTEYRKNNEYGNQRKAFDRVNHELFMLTGDTRYKT